MDNFTPNIKLSDSTPISGAIVAAMFVFVSHLFLLLVIQAENYFMYPWPGSHSVGALSLFLVDFVFGQFENILVAALLGILILFTSPNVFGRVISYAIVLVANLYLVFDQVGFKLFFDHFDPSMLEGTRHLSELMSSITAELDKAFYINLFIFISIAVVLALLYLRSTPTREIHLPLRLGGLYHSRRGLIFLVMLLAIEAFFPVRSEYVKLYHHPFHNLVASLNESPQQIASAATPSVEKPGNPINLQRLRFGKVTPDPGEDARLESLLEKSRAHKPRLNIIWVIMESVGSEQLLNEQGVPDPTITPTLARLAKHSVIFNSMYSVFPGTVRSHVDMLTGGRTLTWGSVFKELSYPYEGPTLVQSLSKAGYDTAMFSAQKLDFENMNGFYKQMGYDYYYDFGEADPDFQAKNSLQSWGAKEPPIVALAMKWLDQRRNPSRPFFLQYLTVATHHPYVIPSDYRGPIRGHSRKDDYLNALNYSDAALGLLISHLKAHHLLDNTLIVIDGDHGEAFGKYHAHNYVHKNAIYEENIKNFLLISNPGVFPETVTSQRITSIGDIMPTILSMVDLPSVDVPGRSMMSKSYPQHVVYFYKNTNPEQIGLRDGEWKYISAGLSGRPELYNLMQDPRESFNVAQIYPDHVALYKKLTTAWYLKTNHDFVSQLKDFHYPGGKELRAVDLKNPGPKLLGFGYQRLQKDNSEKENSNPDFIELPTFNPFEKVVAWTRWVAFSEDKVIHFVWTSPSGEAHNTDFTVKAGWTTSWVNSKLPLPMQEGTWKLQLQNDGKTLLTGTFTVDGKAPLHVQRDKEEKAKEYAVGKYISNDVGKEEFSSKVKIYPTDHIVIWTRWKQLDYKRRIIYRWKSPSGKITEFYFDVNEGWDQTWVNLGNDQPVEVGHWEVSMWDGKHRLGSTGFDVLPVSTPSLK